MTCAVSEKPLRASTPMVAHRCARLRPTHENVLPMVRARAHAPANPRVSNVMVVRAAVTPSRGLARAILAMQRGRVARPPRGARRLVSTQHVAQKDGRALLLGHGHPRHRGASSFTLSRALSAAGLGGGAPIMSLKKCHYVPTKGQLLSDIMALF